MISLRTGDIPHFRVLQSHQTHRGQMPPGLFTRRIAKTHRGQMPPSLFTSTIGKYA